MHALHPATPPCSHYPVPLTVHLNPPQNVVLPFPPPTQLLLFSDCLSDDSEMEVSGSKRREIITKRGEKEKRIFVTSGLKLLSFKEIAVIRQMRSVEKCCFCAHHSGRFMAVQVGGWVDCYIQQDGQPSITACLPNTVMVGFQNTSFYVR